MRSCVSISKLLLYGLTLFAWIPNRFFTKNGLHFISRAHIPIPFVTGDKDLDALFVKEAEAAGFVNLKGHRTVGGMRASIYNAMPEEGVVKLVEFMKKFEAEHADA